MRLKKKKGTEETEVPVRRLQVAVSYFIHVLLVPGIHERRRKEKPHQRNFNRRKSILLFASISVKRDSKSSYRSVTQRIMILISLHHNSCHTAAASQPWDRVGKHKSPMFIYFVVGYFITRCLRAKRNECNLFHLPPVIRVTIMVNKIQHQETQWGDLSFAKWGQWHQLVAAVFQAVSSVWRPRWHLVLMSL